jgi:Domain of unknown function (DUF4351)
VVSIIVFTRSEPGFSRHMEKRSVKPDPLPFKDTAGAKRGNTPHLNEKSSISAISGAIMEMVTSIMVSKFEQLSRKDIDTMLGITLKETRVYQEATEEATANLIFLQLNKRFGQELSEEVCAQIESLPLPTLQRLGQALLDFTSLADLESWLKAQ